MKDQARIWKYVFAIACLLTLALEVLPGRLAFFDEVFFKAAGRHWAATGYFAAPEIVGRVNVQPGLDSIYFAQPPLYTFLFGVYTRLLGFGPHRCILFDAVIHILLALCTVQLARRVFRAPAGYAYAAGIVVLFAGTRGRPDELAMCLAIAGILCWTLPIAPQWQALACGIAFGLCGATSIGACLFLSPLALLVGYHRGALKLGTALQAVLCGIAVGLLCVSPILLSHPLAYRQLMAHAADQSPQLGALAGGAVQSSAIHAAPGFRAIVGYEAEMTRWALRFGPAVFAILLGTLCVILLCLRSAPRQQSRAWGQSAAVAFGGALAVWLMMPGKYTYLWFFGPWLLALAATVLGCSFANLRRGVRAMVVFACAVCLFAVLGLYAKDRVIMLSLPSGQTFYANMDHVRDVVPSGARVATGEYWWALADKCQVVDPYLSHPVPLELNYIIKTGNGSGAPGKPVLFPEYFEDFATANHFVVVEDDLNRSPLKVGAIRVTHSAWGFGPYILARSSEGMNGRPRTVSDLQSSAPQ